MKSKLKSFIYQSKITLNFLLFLFIVTGSMAIFTLFFVSSEYEKIICLETAGMRMNLVKINLLKLRVEEDDEITVKNFQKLIDISKELEEIKSMMRNLKKYRRICESIDSVVELFNLLFEKLSAKKITLIGYERILNILLSRIDEFLNELAKFIEMDRKKMVRVGRMLIILSAFALIFFSIWISQFKRKLLDFSLKFTNMVKKSGDEILRVSRGDESVDFMKNSEFKINYIEEMELLEVIQRFSKEIKLDRIINSLSSEILEDLIPKMFENLKDYIPYNRIGVAFFYGNEFLITETAATDYSNILLKPGYKYHIDETTLGKLLSTNRPRVIQDLERYFERVHKSEPTKLLLREGIRSNITVPLFVNGKPFGFLFFSSKKKNVFNDMHLYRAMRVGNLVIGILKSSYLTQELIAQISLTFAEIIGKKDLETGNHLIRVSKYSRTIAEKLQLPQRLVREMEWFSPLHDIGKVGIPQEILIKPGKLTNEEYEIMKKHVLIGEEIMKNMDNRLYRLFNRRYFETAIDIISSHHEKWDGTGYPRGLKGEKIPLPGRIMAVADVFDALTSKRPYKDPIPFDESVNIISENKGSHFDPKIVDAFLDGIEDIRKIYDMYRDEGMEVNLFDLI